MAGSKKNQPKIAIPRIGISAKLVVTVCTRLTNAGPITLAKLNAHTSTSTAMQRGIGSDRIGKK